jgi:hypothetical protein
MSLLKDAEHIINWITDIDITVFFHLMIEFILCFTPFSSVLLMIFSLVLQHAHVSNGNC